MDNLAFFLLIISESDRRGIPVHKNHPQFLVESQDGGQAGLYLPTSQLLKFRLVPGAKLQLQNEHHYC
jgi:hypothetical protein